jgi:GT2 family glycosyltransferase
MSKIFFVIPVFNRLKYTKECLKILEDNQESTFFKNNTIEIVIADDGSTDGTHEWVKTNYPKVVVLKGSGNLWYSGSMNLGISYALKDASCDYIMIWENDIFPDESFFKNLQKIIEQSKNPDIICAKIFFRNPPDRIFSMGGYFNLKTGRKEIIGYMKPDSHEFNNVLSVDWFCGQGVLVPRVVFDKIGLFDANAFPQYHGDSDFALRAKKAGFSILVHPELRVWNDTETSGLSHIKNKSLKIFIRSLYSIRSNNNISKDIKFYRRHTTSARAYLTLVKSYVWYIGSYLMWKTLGLFHIEKKDN